jgi:uncharacterized protein (TIGR00369 family)
MPFEPKDPNWEQRVRASFGRQRMLVTIGAALERLEPGEVDVRVPFREALSQQHGFMHAGAVTTAVDTACGFAALSLMPEGAGVLTIEFKVSLLAPAKGDAIVARGRVVKPGRNVTFCEGKVIALEGAAERLVATMSATMLTVQGRAGIVD